ncbi:MAG: hypothetical protein EAZ42_02705 [Verrucomicrobia bacterium]|nr:MAG: hypothetical protein EAZ42_02705 [Verrucomicrobiota bacterium]
MKPITLISLLLTAVISHAQPAVEATPTPEVTPEQAEQPKKLTPTQEKFLNLPEESRKDFAKHIGEASRYFQQKRIFEAMEEIRLAELIFSDSPQLLNLKASCFVEFRDFKNGEFWFKAALALDPNSTNIKFNVAEVYFVTGQWAKAVPLYEEIMQVMPPENIIQGRLVEFKKLLCLKKLGRHDEVKILAEKYDFLDDSPFYYYSKAALAFADGDELKAEEWLGIARRIFTDPNTIAAWDDTLVEFGYIKSFYGADFIEDPK